MAGIQDNLTDETSDEINLNYRTVNLPPEDDENEEGLAEYLDLELENASLEDTADRDEYCNRGVSATASNQSSVLKKNYVETSSGFRADGKKSSSSKPTRSTSTTNQTQMAASTTNNRKSSRRGTKRKTPNNYENVNVITAVNEINANLANSTNFINDNGAIGMNNSRNFSHSNSSARFEATAVKSKNDLDGVDLFFQSMAQTVMSLPTPIQARVKMDICKIIAQAEIKYSTKINLSEELSPS